MLMLLFQVDDRPWAIAASEIKDIVPLTTIEPYIQAETSTDITAENAAVAIGLLNYHGERLPVVDVSAVIAHNQAPDTFSTRIAIVDVPSIKATDVKATGVEVAGPVAASGVCSADTSMKCALVLEQACRTIQLTEPASLPVHSPYVKRALKGNSQVIRQLAVTPLVHHVIGSMNPHADDHARNYRLRIA